MTDSFLDIRSLSKRYGARVIFDRFSQQFESGCHGVIGPNGVGKSTLLSILGGSEPFQAGSIRLAEAELGDPDGAYLKQTGYCPDRLSFYPFLTVREFWGLAAGIRGLPVPDASHVLVQGLNLAREINTRLDALSLGTQKKVLLVTALIHGPALLLLDEPTDELDATSARFLTHHLKRMEGTITIISTHDETLLADLGADVLELGDV